MRTENLVILIGHVGRDPEVRALGNGGMLAMFTLATDRGKAGERTTDWHRIKVFGQGAEFVDVHVRKGALVYVRGRIENGSYERDGVKIPTFEIMAHSVTLLSPRDAEVPRSVPGGGDEGEGEGSQVGATDPN